MDGAAYSRQSLALSMISDEGVDGFLLPIGLGGPLAPEPFPLLMLRVLCSAQSIL